MSMNQVTNQSGIQPSGDRSIPPAADQVIFGLAGDDGTLYIKNSHAPAFNLPRDPLGRHTIPAWTAEQGAKTFRATYPALAAYRVVPTTMHTVLTITGEHNYTCTLNLAAHVAQGS